MRLFRALRFSTKALIIPLAFAAPFLGLILWQLDHQSVESTKDRQGATRQHVEVAHGILVAANKQETTDKLNRAQAQALAIEMTGTLRYEGSEHFWINDMRPQVLMHPIKPELNDNAASSTGLSTVAR